MTPAQIALIRSSFAQVEPIREQAAAIFYARLFELAPEVRPLFKGDMSDQGRKLMAMLKTVVGTLDLLDILVPMVQRLAERHVGYGAQPAHYAVVGQALLDTLQAGLGPAFTAETREAWTVAYGTLASLMIAAAESQASKAAAA
jgi:hemoglobin-like flavoprotein